MKKTKPPLYRRGMRCLVRCSVTNRLVEALIETAVADEVHTDQGIFKKSEVRPAKKKISRPRR